MTATDLREGGRYLLAGAAGNYLVQRNGVIRRRFPGRGLSSARTPLTLADLCPAAGEPDV